MVKPYLSIPWPVLLLASLADAIALALGQGAEDMKNESRMA
jgi:hypothetical protein